jgi:hypothetical protein
MRVAAVIAGVLVGLAVAAAVAWGAMKTRSLAAETRCQSCMLTAQALPDPRSEYEQTLSAKYGDTREGMSRAVRMRDASAEPARPRTASSILRKNRDGS